MKQNFTETFKIQAVKKALMRPPEVTLKAVAASLGIGRSTLDRWIAQAKQQRFETLSMDDIKTMTKTTKEKRPQDWTAEQRLQIIIECEPLADDKCSEYCREKGLYPHHIKQWKTDFLKQTKTADSTSSRKMIKTLRSENKQLKKELTRKEKALAETAALLVLQKKVHVFWENGEGEDSLR